MASEVLSVIASIMISEVEGITGHFTELRKTDLKEISRRNLNRDLKIEAKEGGIYIDVFYSLKHSINISKTTNQIQSAIFNSIMTMTAIEPQQTSIYIKGIITEKQII